MGKEFHGEASNFPGAPKNFDPENPYADGVAMIQHREHIVREKMIKVETAKVRLPLSLNRPPPPPPRVQKETLRPAPRSSLTRPSAPSPAPLSSFASEFRSATRRRA